MSADFGFLELFFKVYAVYNVNTEILSVNFNI